MKLIKQYLVLIIFGLTSVLFAQDFTLSINDFSGGIRNDIDNTKIVDNQVEDAQNVLFDTDSTAKKRSGLTKANTTALGSADDRNIYSQFEYRRSDGSSYHIVHSSTSLYSSLGSASFSIFDKDINASYNVNYTVFMDTLCYVNGTSMGIKAWNTTSTFTHTTAYEPKYITAWQNRLVIAGDTDEPSYVRFSAFQDPSNWTTGTNLATGSNLFSINTQDGQKITGFFYSPNGNLGILKEKSVWEIGGYDSTDFYQRLVIPDLGCSDSASVGYKDGMVYWLSSEGIVAYNGRSYSVVSDFIDSTIGDIQQLNQGSGSYSKNTTDDWNNYTSTSNVKINNAALYLNNVISTNTITNGYTFFSKDGNNYHILAGSPIQYKIYNSTAAAFTYTETSSVSYGYKKKTQLYDGKFYVVYQAGSWPNQGIIISTKTFNTSDLWTISSPQKFSISTTANQIIPSISKLYITCTNDAFATFWKIYVSSFNVTSNAWVSAVQIGPNTSGQGDFEGGYRNNGNVVIESNNKLYMATSLASCKHIPPNYNYYSQLRYSSCTASDFSGVYYFDIESTTRTTTTPSDYYNYECFSIDISTDASGFPHITYIREEDELLIHAYYDGSSWNKETVKSLSGKNLETYSVSLYIDTSSNVYILHGDQSNNLELSTKLLGGSWQTEVLYNIQALAESTYINKSDSGYLMCSMVSNNNNTFYLTSEATGYYISEIHDTGIDNGTINSIIAESYTKRANSYHYIRSSDTMAGIVSKSWTSVTPNSSISETIYKYLQYKIELATYTLTDINDPSYVDSILVNYSSLSGSKRLSTMFYDGRLWSGVSISSTTCLDKTLVLDRNNAWTKFSFTQPVMNYLNLNGTPFMGSNDGYIYRLDTQDSDDGSAINAYVLTKSYDITNIFIQKSMINLYLTALQSGNWNLSLDYYLDKILTPTETFDINLNTAELINYKIPLITRPRFYTIQFKLYNSNANEPFDFHSLYSVMEGYPLE